MGSWVRAPAGSQDCLIMLGSLFLFYGDNKGWVTPKVITLNLYSVNHTILCYGIRAVKNMGRKRKGAGAEIGKRLEM